jgi:hypothetical protein
MADEPKNWKKVVLNLKARANNLKAKTNSHKIKRGGSVEMAPRKTRRGGGRGGGRGKRRPAKRVPVQFGPKTFQNTMKNIFSPEVNEARSWGDFQLNENEKMKKEKEKKKGGRRTRKNKKNY